MEIIRDIQSFKTLAEEWNHLPQPLQTPLLRHEWFLSSLQTFHSERNMYVVVLRDSKGINAAAPLVFRRIKGISRLELIGSSHLHEPGGLLFRTHSDLEELSLALTQLKYPVVLSRIEHKSPLLTVIKKMGKHRGVTVSRNTNPSLFVACSTDWQSYYSTLSSRRRYDHRRAEKRAREMGEVQFSTYRPKTDRSLELVDEAIDIEAKSWKSRIGSAIKHNHALSAFLHQYLEIASKNQDLLLFFMEIDKCKVAMQICIEFNNTVWVLKIGFDEKWAKCSPGVLLMNYAIKHAFDNGHKRFEFLGSSEPWLDVWATDRHEYETVLYYPFSSPGIFGLGSDLLSFGFGRVKSTYLRQQGVKEK